MTNTKTKKLIGGVLIIALMLIMGAVLVNAERDDIREGISSFDCHSSKEMGNGPPEMLLEISDEQRIEIDTLKDTMIEDGSSPEEIDEAVRAKLQEFGIDLPTEDERLDSEIENTTKRLDILNRQKELREEGYSWEEIRDICSEEFEPDMQEHQRPGRMPGNMFTNRHGGRCFDHPFLDGEETEV